MNVRKEDSGRQRRVLSISRDWMKRRCNGKVVVDEMRDEEGWIDHQEVRGGGQEEEEEGLRDQQQSIVKPAKDWRKDNEFLCHESSPEPPEQMYQNQKKSYTHGRVGRQQQQQFTYEGAMLHHSDKVHPLSSLYPHSTSTLEQELDGSSNNIFGEEVEGGREG